jgi:hypothetical protein
MNRSEIKVDYAVKHISANGGAEVVAATGGKGRGARARPKSATALATGRRHSMLAATIQDEFVLRKSNNHQNGGGNHQNGGGNKRAQQSPAKSHNNAAENALKNNTRVDHADTHAAGMGAATFAPPGGGPPSAMRRPATAPKRRPPMMVSREEELPLWRSRGKTDMVDTLIQMDNKVSMSKRGEWPKEPKAPEPTENVLGLSNSGSRKTISSSHSRSRFAKTSGPIANLEPYKMPPHYFPPAIYRDEIPTNNPALRMRSSWSGTTTCRDIDERAKPEGKPSVSSTFFHETYRLPPNIDRDYVNVTTSLDTITAAYPRGRF